MNYEEAGESYNAFEDAFERIKKATGLRTQVEVAKLLDIRQSSISDAKRRKSVPDGWLIKLYQLYNLNPNWVLEGEQPQFLGDARGGALNVKEPLEGFASRKPKFHNVMVCAMTSGQEFEENWRESPIESLTISDKFYLPTLLVVKMDEDDMEPIIRRGAYVGIDKERKTIRSGGLYAIDIPVEGLVIKRVAYDSENARLVLRSENPAQEPQFLGIEEAANRIVGRIIWTLQEL
jgi:hypothetical protein